MLEQFKEFINKKLHLKSDKSSNLFENLKIWNKDLQPYLDVISPQCSFFETHKKIKELPLENFDLNREFIKLLCKIDSKTQKPRYETIINNSYQDYENILKSIDEKDRQNAEILLNEIKYDDIQRFKSISS